MKQEKRVYNSESREAGAAITRARILKTAKDLFRKEGFEQVTISSLAKAAGVSMPTIYAVFKSKAGVLEALVDEALPQEQFIELVQESMKEPSPIKRLGITASIARKIYDAERELMEILEAATVVAPEFKEQEQAKEKRRYERQGEYVKKMIQEQIVKNGMTLEKARDILWGLTGRDMYRLFVIERGWSSDEYEKWLHELLVISLLQGPHEANKGK